MDKNENNLDYIDLLVAFIKGELDPQLHSDIENTISKDPVLKTTIDGLKKLLDDHQGDRVALKEYFKNTQHKIFSNLSNKS
jgi:hypothetical protein